MQRQGGLLTGEQLCQVNLKRDCDTSQKSQTLEQFLFPGCITEEDTDYSGNDIVETVAESQRACVDFCKTIAGAPFWTWNSGTKRCIVKSSSSGRTSAVGAVSGNRECGKGERFAITPQSKGTINCLLSSYCQVLSP